jgi:chromosome segregation ATPase
MRRTIGSPLGWLLLAILAIPALAQAQSGSGKTTYRWVDAEGHVHFGDSVPIEASKEERQIIDEHGSVRQVLPRQKTDAELVEEQRHQREVQQKRDYDNSLLKTYSTIEDLKKAGNDRLDTIDNHIEQAQKQVNDTQDKFAGLQSKVASAKAGGKEVDPELQRQIDQVDSDLQTNKATLSQLRQDRQKAEDQYLRDVQRYKELQTGMGITTKN